MKIRKISFLNQPLMLAFVLVVFLVGCGESQQSAVGNTQSAPKVAIEPSDPELAAIYLRSCIACHGSGAPAIPQSGDMEAWRPRAEKGMEVLLDNVINGVGGMPPLGMCMDCDPEQYEALIQFMAGDALISQ